MLPVKTEGICRPTRVGFGITSKPLFYRQYEITYEQRTCFCSGSLLEFLMGSHLIYLSGHSFDVRDNQFIEVTVGVFVTHAQLSSDGEFVCLVKLEDVYGEKEPDVREIPIC